MSSTENATATSHPTEIVAPPDTPFLDIVREFEAAPALVFRAHTDPALVVQWLGPRNRQMRVEHWDSRSGGTYRYVMAGDADFEAGFHGVFHTVAADRLIIQTFEFEGAPDQVCLQSATFTELGGGRTRLATHSVFPSVAARDMALATGMTSGIEDSMARLEEVLAR